MAPGTPENRWSVGQEAGEVESLFGNVVKKNGAEVGEHPRASLGHRFEPTVNSNDQPQGRK